MTELADVLSVSGDLHELSLMRNDAERLFCYGSSSSDPGGCVW